MTEAIQTNLEHTEVTSALHGILTTDKFAASPQMSAFLKYVVEQTLLGNTRRIKAFTVGIEALGKPSSFDPQTDPSVRVLAKRLRTSLDTYYSQNPLTEIFIEMKPGSYIPKFLRRSEVQESAPVEHHYAAQQAHAMTGTEGGAHINVQQTAPSPEAEQNNVNKFWQNYRSASKVA